MDRPSGLTRARGRFPALAAAALAFAASPPAPRDIAAAAGAWDLSLQGSHRKCRVTLGLEAVGIGRALRFPAGCRRALPIVNALGSWLFENGLVRLLDREGKPMLAFQAEPDATGLVARIENDTYWLEPTGKTLQEARLPAAPPIGVPQPTPVDPARAPPAETLPGSYWVDRYTEKEVCRIELSRAAINAAGRSEARLMEGCRDAGLATFDPAAWRYEAGRLTLTSRRGYEVTLISERDGQWRRDPEVGATLVLRKAP